MAAYDGRVTPPDPPLHQLTSFHVNRAIQGNDESLAWMVTRFSPLLHAQAAYRLVGSLRHVADPDDLVAEVWAVALPRLSDIHARAGRVTPVLAKFLSRTLLFCFNNLAKRHARGDLRPRADDEGRPVSQIPEETSGVVARLSRREGERAVAAALARLEPDDREIIVLRGIEQNPVGTIATLLGVTENVASVRYHRALKKARALIPESILSELPDD